MLAVYCFCRIRLLQDPSWYCGTTLMVLGFLTLGRGEEVSISASLGTKAHGMDPVNAFLALLGSEYVVIVAEAVALTNSALVNMIKPATCSQRKLFRGGILLNSVIILL